MTRTPEMIISKSVGDLVKCKARQLAGTRSFLRHEAADIAQELLLDLWARSANFNPARANYRTFAHRIIDHRVASLIEARHSLSRGQGAIHIELADDDNSPRNAGDGHSSRTPALSRGWRVSDGGDADLRTDVQRVLAAVSLRDRKLAALLSEFSPVEAGLRLGISRATVYRAIRRLRVAFKKAGLST